MIWLSLAVGASTAYWVSMVMLSALLLVSVAHSRRRRRATASKGTLATKQCLEPVPRSPVPWQSHTSKALPLLASSYYRACNIGHRTSVSYDGMIPLYWRRMQKLLEEEATRQQLDNYTGGW